MPADGHLGPIDDFISNTGITWVKHESIGLKVRDQAFVEEEGAPKEAMERCRG